MPSSSRKHSYSFPFSVRFLLGILITALLFAESASAWNLRGVASSYESDQARQSREVASAMAEVAEELATHAIIAAME